MPRGPSLCDWGEDGQRRKAVRLDWRQSNKLTVVARSTAPGAEVMRRCGQPPYVPPTDHALPHAARGHQRLV